MNPLDRTKHSEADSDDDELSENVERNLESVLCIFPLRKKGKDKVDKIDDITFEKVKKLMECPVCLDIFKEPAYIKECMHRFCRQCIERIIRTFSQDNKGCPICRLPLGSKRVLRSDSFIENCIKKIFPNLKEYLNLEETQQKTYFSRKLKETAEPKKKKKDLKELDMPLPENTLRLKRSSSQKEPKRKMRFSDDENSDADNVEERKQKKVKRKKAEDPEYSMIESKAETKEENSSDIKQDFREDVFSIAQITGNSSKEELEIMKKIINSSNCQHFFENCDIAISFGFEPLPTHSYLKYFDNQNFKTSSSITVEHLCQLLCNKLNLNEKGMHEKIKLYGKKENKFEFIERDKSLKEIAKSYWSHLLVSDIEIYDVYNSIEEYMDKKFKVGTVHRIIYYAVDEDIFFS